MVNHVHGEYWANVRRKIDRKMRSLMRSSLKRGAEQSILASAPFIGDMEQNVLLMEQSKIEATIARASSLVAQALQREETLIVPMTHKLLRNIAEHTDVEITAHADDVAIIKGALSDSHGRAAMRTVIFQEDESFDRGSLLIKANKSIIDAHVHTQLARARALMLQRLETKHGNAH
jgi:flagellar biosynthesis/type III secretory pathway protein FliH